MSFKKELTAEGVMEKLAVLGLRTELMFAHEESDEPEKPVHVPVLVEGIWGKAT